MVDTVAPEVTGSRRTGGGRAPVAVIAAAVVALALFAAAVVQLTHGDDGGATLGAALARLVRYAGSLTAVGGLVFLAFVRPPSVPADRSVVRLTIRAALVGIAAAAAAIPLHAAYLTGTYRSAIDPGTLGTALGSGVGRSALLGAAGLAAIVVAARTVDTPAASAVGAVGVLAALGSFVLTGHTATAQPQALVWTANVAHTTAAAVWTGGLLALLVALRSRRAENDLHGGARLVGRFSTAAVVAVVVVAVGGTALAWSEVRALAALDTPYGWVLLTKVAFVVAVVALGAYNNVRLVPGIVERGERDWRGLRRVMTLEVAGLVAVLAATAVLVDVTPARVAAGVDAEATRIAAFGPEHVATLVVDPARAGTNQYHLYIEQEQRALGTAVEDVTMEVAPTNGPGEAVVITPAQISPDHWIHLGSELDRPGDWEVTIEGVADGQRAQATVTIPVAPAAGR